MEKEHINVHWKWRQPTFSWSIHGQSTRTHAVQKQHDTAKLKRLTPPTHTHTSLGAVNKKQGCQKKNEAFQMVFPHVIVVFSSSYRFPQRWLHTLIKEFILCFLCGMSAYNHQIYMILHVLFRENIWTYRICLKLEWCYGTNHGIESTEKWLKRNGSC